MKCASCGAEVEKNGVCPACHEISLMPRAEETVNFEQFEDKPISKNKIDESSFTELVVPKKSAAENKKDVKAAEQEATKKKSLKNCLWFAPVSVIVLVIIAEIFKALSKNINYIPGANMGYVYYAFVRTGIPSMLQVLVCYGLYRLAMIKQPAKYVQAAMPTCVIPYAAYLFTSYAVGAFNGVFTYAFAGFMDLAKAGVAASAVLGIVQVIIGLFASVLFLNSYYRRLQKILDGKELTKKSKSGFSFKKK